MRIDEAVAVVVTLEISSVSTVVTIDGTVVVVVVVGGVDRVLIDGAIVVVVVIEIGVAAVVVVVIRNRFVERRLLVEFEWWRFGTV